MSTNENKHNTQYLEKYFGLFDESRVSKEAREELKNLFTSYK